MIVNPQQSCANPALPKLASVDNFRDVAGAEPGYPVRGGRMRLRNLFRANRISPSTSDAQFLDELGLVAVHDLREQHEIERHPDAPVDGAKWLHHEIPGIPVDTVGQLRSPEDTYTAMIDNYRTFVSDPKCRAGLASLLTTIARTDGPQLFHCAAGKDRTGWAAALIQHIAGASLDTIIADYLLTDEYSAESRKATLEAIPVSLGADNVSALEPAFHCDIDYLTVAFHEARSMFGSVNGYLTDGLGLEANAIAALRDRLVVPVDGSAL